MKTPASRDIWYMFIYYLWERKYLSYKLLRHLAEAGLGEEEMSPRSFRSVLERENSLYLAAADAIEEKILREWEGTVPAAAETATLCRRHAISLSLIGDGLYPKRLEETADAPLVLFMQGRPEKLRDFKSFLAVVGSRRMTPYGRRFINQEVSKLIPYGVSIISGLAKGCDTEAHLACLERGGFTIACLAHGPDICYPPEHAKIKERIVREGLILSEYPPGTEPRPFRFPQRNRLISGLSEALLVVEAGPSSGSLITADYALEQGREVGVLVGPVFNAAHAGGNRLIREGAVPVFAYQDILDLLRVNTENRPYEDCFRVSLPPILKAVAEEPKSELEISLALQMPLRDVRVKLIEYEAAGKIKRHRGRIFLTRA